MSRFTEQDLTDETIKQLVDAKEPESQDLDYKEREPDNLIKTISAMANTSGGLVLLGISESESAKGNSGLPEAIVGLSSNGLNAFIISIEDKIRRGIQPRIKGLLIKPIEVDGRQVLAIMVPRSLSVPHMIHDGPFYARGERSNYVMSIDQIRQSFLWSHGLRDGARKFRGERLAIIQQNLVPVRLEPPSGSESRLVVHLIPHGAVIEEGVAVLQPDYPTAERIGVLGGHPFSYRPNIDGILFTDSSNPVKEPPIQYTQLFSNGIIETVYGGLERNMAGEEGPVSGSFIEKGIRDFTERALTLLKNHDIQPPLSLWVSLLRFKGCVLSVGGIRSDRVDSRRFDRDEILLPEIIFESLSDAIDELMSPLYDSLWRAAGYEAAPRSR